MRRAEQTAGRPFQQYAGPMLAGFTPAQEQAFSEIGGAQGFAMPYISQAAQFMQNAGQPITITPFSSGAVNQYLSPYTQDVTGSLQNLFNQQNATQLSQVVGNAAAQGAFGGDREAVAAAQTAGQQQLTEAPTMANVLQQGYQTALGEFNAQQQAALQAQEASGWLQQGAGYGLGQLGMEGQNALLGGAQALLGAGNQQQGLAQQGLNIPYEQFMQQQAYPFQTTGWLANIAEGLGGASGGQSSTTYPGPSMFSQLLGGGLAGAGLLGMTGAYGSGGWLSGLLGGGGAGAGYASDAALASPFAGIGGDLTLLGAERGGRIPRQAGGGTPVGLAVPPDASIGYVPNLSGAAASGRGIPPPPSDPALANQSNSMSPLQVLQTLTALHNLGLGTTPPAATGGGGSDFGAHRGGRYAVGGPAPIAFSSRVPMRTLSNLPEFNYAPTFSQAGYPMGMTMVGPGYRAGPLTLPMDATRAGFNRADATVPQTQMNIGRYTAPPISPMQGTIMGRPYPPSVFGSAAPQVPQQTPATGVPAGLAAILRGYGLPSAQGGTVGLDTAYHGFQAGGRPDPLEPASHDTAEENSYRLWQEQGGERWRPLNPGMSLQDIDRISSNLRAELHQKGLGGFQFGGVPQGDPGSSLQAAGASAFGGISPLQQGLLQRYMGMSGEQLQELAMRTPPNSPYGATIQRALQFKHMHPQAGAAPANIPVAPMGATTGQVLAAPPAPMPQGIASAPPPSLTARGGRAGWQQGGAPDIDLTPSESGQNQYGDFVLPRETPAPPPRETPPRQTALTTPPPRGGFEPAETLPGSGFDPAAPSPASSAPTLPRGGFEPAPGGAAPAAAPAAPTLRPTRGVLDRTPPPTAGLAAPPGSEPMSGEMRNYDPRGLSGYIAQSAQKYGVDPFVALRVAQSEGLGTYVGDHGTSFGAFQLNMLPGSEGTRFQKETGLDPRDPRNEHAMIDWTMRNVGQTGWGPYHGAARLGIGQWEGITRGGGGAPTTTSAAWATAPADGLATRPETYAPTVPPREKTWTESPWFPLVAIGAGMMASRSPHLGVAIGEGLETGIKTAEAQTQRETAADLAEARAGTVEMQGRHMADLAANARDRLNEAVRHHQELEAGAAANLDLRGQVAAGQQDLRLQAINNAAANAAALEAEREKRRQIEQQNADREAGRTQLRFGEGPDPTDPTGQRRIAGTYRDFLYPDPKTGKYLPSEFYPGETQSQRAPAAMSETQYRGLIGARAKLLEDAWKLDPSNMNKTPPNFGAIATTQINKERAAGMPQAGTAQPAQAPAAGGQATLPPVPPALQGKVRAYNPSTQTYLGNDGAVYDVNGNVVTSAGGASRP